MLVFTRPLRALVLMLIITLTSCQTSRQAPPHPPLALHQRPMREIQALFLSDKDFSTHRMANLASAKNLPQRAGAALASTARMTVVSTLGMFALLGGAEDISRLFVDESVHPGESWSARRYQKHPTDSQHAQLIFQADDIAHARLPAISPGTFVRLRSNASVMVTDTHGSYYARADQIQYRPDRQVLLFRGHVSVSAVNAPDLKSFGLLCIDLARCQAFYTGS